MNLRAVSDRERRRLLAEAQAQYAVRPSDYLEGVLVGLTEALNDPAALDWRRAAHQDQLAADRSPVMRARDFYRGLVAALEWSLDGSNRPPVITVMTQPRRPPRH